MANDLPSLSSLGALAAVLAALLPVPGAIADSGPLPVQYGIVEAVVPMEVGGFLGIGRKPGAQYTVRLDDGSSLAVPSPSRDLAIGDCVAIVGLGDDARVGRADHSLCRRSAASVAAGSPMESLLSGPESGASGAGAGAAGGGACAQARDEVRDWPVGLGRRRALLRELLICGEPPPASATGLEGSCIEAWRRTEATPFGPARRAARQAALATCAR